MSLFASAYEWVSRVAEKATLPTDSDVEKTKKAVLTIVATIIAFLAIFWGVAYVLLGKPFSGAIPLGYAFISFVSIGYFFRTKRFAFFRFSQLLLIFLLPFLLMWSLGGFAHGSVVMVWAFFTPLAAMMFADAAYARKWLYAFLAVTVFSALVDPYFAANVVPLDEFAIRIFFVLNMGFGFAAIYIVLNFFMRQREQSHHEVAQAKKDLEDSNRQLQENEARIRQLMLTDGLTGVANRRHLDERLQMELERSSRYENALSLMIADIDFFKRINDNFGHVKGDEVIMTFANVLADSLRSADFIARFGGEEFVVILPETDCSAAVALAERVREAMQVYQFDAISYPVTASFGVTEVLQNDSLECMLKRADKALYQAKEAGRNCVIAV